MDFNLGATKCGTQLVTLNIMEVTHIMPSKDSLSRLVVRISCTLPPRKYALTKKTG